MNIKRLIIILAAVIVPSVSALAGGMTLRPGLWQFSSRSEYVGTSFSSPLISYKRCLTKKQSQNPWTHMSKPGKQHCVFTHEKVVGNKATWTMECRESGSKMTGTGSAIASDPEHFSSVAQFLAHSDGETMKLKATTTGKWLSASCGKRQ